MTIFLIKKSCGFLYFLSVFFVRFFWTFFWKCLMGRFLHVFFLPFFTIFFYALGFKTQSKLASILFLERLQFYKWVSHRLKQTFEKRSPESLLMLRKSGVFCLWKNSGNFQQGHYKMSCWEPPQWVCNNIWIILVFLESTWYIRGAFWPLY